MSKVMRAGRLVAHGTMVCEEAPVREPGDGELLVRSMFASICGSDLHSVYPPSPPARLPGPPGYPGHEGVGEVVASNYADFPPGERVLCVPNFYNGMCFAEYQTIAGSFCVPLGEGAAPEHQLMAQQLGTVVFALKRRPLELSGKHVAIIGQGSAGAFFAFLARRAGARTVVVSDLSESRLAYARTLGVDAAVNEGEFVHAVREATGGRGAEVVIEAVGTDATLALSVEIAAPLGELLWFGLPEGTGERMPFTFGQFFAKRLCAASAFGAQEEPGHESFREALALIEKGEIDVSPLMSHVLPLEEIGRAFDLAHSREDGALKVSIAFGDAQGRAVSD